MALFKFRVVKPNLSDWIEFEGESFGTAIQEYHFQNSAIGCSIKVPLANGGHERQTFATFESEDGEQLISRVCYKGIYRAGGVKSFRDLHWVANQLQTSIDSLQGSWDKDQDYPS